MPNTGMLDHKAYSWKRSGKVYWMGSWPDQATGYQTLRFSKYLSGQMRSIQKEHHRQTSAKSRPTTANVLLNNSIAPFHTQVKPTCGYHYFEGTEHKKFKIGIKPSNVVAWRPVASAKPNRSKPTN